MKRDVIETLRLHFGCLEEQVTCSRVKPFLPGLLLPSVQIRIPTPITVHIDHCPECAEDLRALRNLGLDAEQLERLEQLYGRVDVRDNARLCRRARSRIAAFVQGSLEGIDAEVLDHLCTCPHCRPEVFQGRQKLLENAPAEEAGAAACRDAIPLAQLFDYAVPYGRTAASPGPAAAAHVRTCGPCLRRVQMLDETIYGIAERTNSGVATVYRTGEAVKLAGQTDEAEEIVKWLVDPYAAYPIDVQVTHSAPEPMAAQEAPAADLTPAVKCPACHLPARFLLKTAVTVAAVIMLTLLFRGTTSTTAGLTLAQVFKAFETAEDVHVARFYPPTGQLVREQWISRPADFLFTTIGGQQHILYDLGAKKKYAYSASGLPADVADLGEREYADSRRLMEACLGFTLNDVPHEAKWTPVNRGEDTDTYELAYSGRLTSGEVILWKWRIAVDPLTRLPRELDGFRRASTAEEWNSALRTEVRYLTEAEMKTALAERHIPWPR